MPLLARFTVLSLCASLFSNALRFKEEHLLPDYSFVHQLQLQRKHNRYPEFPGLLTNRVVLEHAERAVGTRAAEGHEEAGQGHRHEADRDGS